MDEETATWIKKDVIPLFQNARHLADVVSKEDPQKEPYKSKYKSRDLLLDLRCTVQERAKDLIERNNSNCQLEEKRDDEAETSESEHGSIQTVLACIEYELAMIGVDTEEVSVGEEGFMTCLSLLKGIELHPDNVSLVIATNNQLGILWSNRGEHKKAYRFLRKGELLYLQYKKMQDIGPKHFKCILESSSDMTSLQKHSEFENLHTHTLYYLAQVFTKLNRSAKAAKYCHVTLARQMNTGQYEPSDWGLNCATLSQYYLCKENYKLSRHCLACALRVYSEAMEKLEQDSGEEDDEERDRRKEKVLKGQADIARCWMKYCLNLLQASHEAKLGAVQRSSEAEEDGSGQEKDEKEEEEMSDIEEDMESLEIDSKLHEAGVDVCYARQVLFDTLEVDSIENEVSCEKAKHYEEARQLFLIGQKWMTKSKEFYVLDGYVTDHVEILQDYSQLLKYLTYFENDFDTRCKMHKRRIDPLNGVLLELNPQHFLIISRQLAFEIGEIYGEMADLKRAIIEEDPSRFSVESVRKINRLLLQGVKYFETFVNSYKHKEVLPETFEDDAVRGVLLAHFYMARYYGKYLTPDKAVKTEYLKKEKGMYEYIVNYCEAHPDACEKFEEELKVSREILLLFPAKMNQLLDSS